MAAWMILQDEIGLAISGIVIGLGMATVPDFDEFAPIRHRGVTHTLSFVVTGKLLVAGSVGLFAVLIGLPHVRYVFVACLANTLSLGTHVLADSLTPGDSFLVGSLRSSDNVRTRELVGYGCKPGMFRCRVCHSDLFCQSRDTAFVRDTR